MIIETSHANNPVWKDLQVHSVLPEQLLPLQEIVRNLWWTWNEEAKALFEVMDPVSWEDSDKNPVMLLQGLTKERGEEIVKDESAYLPRTYKPDFYNVSPPILKRYNILISISFT